MDFRWRRWAQYGQTIATAGTLAANVAQGHERLLRADYVQHLSIARGTLQRLETLLEVAYRLRYLDVAEAAALDRRCAAVGRHLSQLIRSVYGLAGRRGDGTAPGTPD